MKREEQRIRIHERVTAWREHAGISKAELARQCDVSSAAVSQWEKPKGDDDAAEPSHESVEKIASACGATLSEFWGPLPKIKKARAS